MPSCAAHDNPNWFSTATIKCEQPATWLWDRYVKPNWKVKLTPTPLCDKHIDICVSKAEKENVMHRKTSVRRIKGTKV